MTTGVFDGAPSNEQITPPETPKETPNVEIYEKRLMDKDAFIEQLKSETAELRKSVAEKAAIEDLLAEVRQNANKPLSPPVEGTPPATGTKEAPTEEQLVERVQKALEAKAEQTRAESNRAKVEEHLIATYGSKEAAAKFIQETATSLGLTPASLSRTAAESPDAFFRLANVQSAPKQTLAPRGDINTQALGLSSTAPKEGTNAYYDQLRKDLGDEKFFSPKIQQQRMKDAMRLGADFFN